MGLDPSTGKLVEGDVAAQTRQAMANIAAVLGDCGASLSDVAKTTVFLVDMGDFDDDDDDDDDEEDEDD